MHEIIDQIKLPPHSLEAEQSVLGGLLLDNNAFDTVSAIINEQDFYRDDHQRIYKCIHDMIVNGQPADTITVAEQLEYDGELDKVGFLPYIASLAQNTPSSANIRRYAEIVRERRVMRNLVEIAGKLADMAYHPMGLTAEQMTSEAEREIFRISDVQVKANSSLYSGYDLARTGMQQYEAEANGEDAARGVLTGLTSLDEVVRSLRPGHLVYLAARPSMGKTALACNIAAHVALVQKKPVLFFSQEMTPPEIFFRLVAPAAQLDHQRLTDGQLFDEEIPRMLRAAALISESALWVEETGSHTLTSLSSVARRLQRQCKGDGGLGLIVVDYLQLMRADSHSRYDNRNNELEAISAGLKALAKHLKVPMLVLSQLNRDAEARDPKGRVVNARPAASMMRGSGALEQDADGVWLLYRDDVYNPQTEFAGKCEVIIGKQRNRAANITVMLDFDRERQLFLDRGITSFVELMEDA